MSDGDVYDRTRARVTHIAAAARQLAGLDDEMMATRATGHLPPPRVLPTRPVLIKDPILPAPASRLAIALSGGGAHGDFQVGALEFLSESWLGSRVIHDPGGTVSQISWPARPDIIAGTSVGAINSTVVAEGLPSSVNDLVAFWSALTLNDSMFVQTVDLNSFVTHLESVGLLTAVAGLSLPLLAALGVGGTAVMSLITAFYNAVVGLPSLYDLGPIESKARASAAAWSATGPGPRASGIAVLELADGQPFLLVRAADDHLVHLQRNSDGTWTAPQAASIGGAIGTTSGWPTVLAGSSGSVAFMFSDSANASAIATTAPADLTETWTRQVVPPPTAAIELGAVAQPISSISSGAGAIAATTAGDGGLFITSCSDPAGSWNAWSLVPDPADLVKSVGRPAMSFWPVSDPTLEPQGVAIATRGLDGLVRWTAATQARPGAGAAHPDFAFQPWDKFAETQHTPAPHPQTVAPPRDAAGEFASLPHAATSGSRWLVDPTTHALILFYRGRDFGLLGALQTAPPGGSTIAHTAFFLKDPVDLGGVITSTPIPIAVGNEIRVYARGMDGAVWFTVPDLSSGSLTPAPWESLSYPSGASALVTSSSPTLGDPEVIILSDGSVHVFVVGRDRQLFHGIHVAGSPVAWERLSTDVFTGVQVRWSMTAEEDNEGRTVDDAGHFVLESDVDFATGTPVWTPAVYDNAHPLVSRVAAVMASSAIPGIFPAVALDDKTWVDGGVRRSIPIRAGIDAGATEVVAIAASAKTPALERPLLAPTINEEVAQLGNGYSLPFDVTVVPMPASVTLPAGLPLSPAPITSYQAANALDVGYRAVMDLMPASILDAELAPESSYPVPVFPIVPTFDVHNPFTIDPGLIKIAKDYGYMRAADILVPGTASIDLAQQSSDLITQLRRRIWIMEQAFFDTHAIVTYRPLYQAFQSWVETAEADVVAAVLGPIVALFEHDSFNPTLVTQVGRLAVSALVSVRAAIIQHKHALHDAVVARSALGLPVPGGIDHWSSNWELHGGVAWADGTTHQFAQTSASQEPAVAVLLTESWRLTAWDGTVQASFPSI